VNKRLDGSRGIDPDSCRRHWGINPNGNLGAAAAAGSGRYGNRAGGNTAAEGSRNHVDGVGSGSVNGLVGSSSDGRSALVAKFVGQLIWNFNAQGHVHDRIGALVVFAAMAREIAILATLVNESTTAGNGKELGV
jgi:hypothetical protein